MEKEDCENCGDTGVTASGEYACGHCMGSGTIIVEDDEKDW